MKLKARNEENKRETFSTDDDIGMVERAVYTSVLNKNHAVLRCTVDATTYKCVHKKTLTCKFLYALVVDISTREWKFE